METIKEFLKPELIWFLVGAVLLLFEFELPGLVLFFFGVGAWIVAAICLFVDISINAQLIIFIISSVLLLVCLRKWLKGMFKGYVTSKQNASKNLEGFIGQRAVVAKGIAPLAPGKIEFHGTNWTAEADEEISEGDSVEIVEKNNLTLKVKKLHRQE
jgi:inner membrane protein